MRRIRGNFSIVWRALALLTLSFLILITFGVTIKSSKSPVLTVAIAQEAQTSDNSSGQTSASKKSEDEASGERAEAKTEQKSNASSEQPHSQLSEERTHHNSVLTSSDVDKLLDTLEKLYSQKAYRFAITKLSSKYKGIKIITNFDNFFTELKELLSKHKDAIEEAGYTLEEFETKLEALYKALIVVQMENQFNDPKFQEKVKKLREMERDPKFPDSKRKYVREALKKLEEIERAVESFKATISSDTLKVVSENMSKITSRLRYAK